MFRVLTIKEFDIIGYGKVEAEEIANFKEKRIANLSDLESSLFNKDNPFSIDLITQQLCLEPDIFLSQADADEEQVIKLAILLERQLNLNVCLDVYIWQNTDAALSKIKNKDNDDPKQQHCDDQSGKLSGSISMCLTAALQQMIERSELVIFLETESCENISDRSKEKNKDNSSSGVYSELQFTQQVQRVIPDRLHKMIESYKHNDSLSIEDKTAIEQIEFSYSIQDHDLTMTNREFEEWLKFSAKKDLKFNPLDLLYTINVNVIDQ